MFGIDISNIQNKIDLRQGKDLFDFAIIKVSEGKTLKDKSAKRFSSELKGMGKLIGCYHFCRPDLNSPEDEAKNFINSVVDCGLLHKAVLVADWETSTKGNTQWLLDFCDLVLTRTGVAPLVYASSYVLSGIGPHIDSKIPLWIAQWPNTYRYVVGAGPEVMEPNTDLSWKIWQYSSTGIFPGYSGRIDLDYSIFTREEWLKMAGEETKEEITEDMRWAIDNGLFLGYKDGTYRPDEPITRGQLATVLARYTRYMFRTE